MTGQLKTYFVISGVLIIVSFALAIIVAIAWIVLLALGFSMPNWMEMLKNYQ